MARRTESPARPRISQPDIPDHLTPAVASRGDDLHAASLELSGTVNLAHSTFEQCEIAVNADSVDLTGATLMDIDMRDLRATSLILRNASVQRLRITGGRVGTFDLSGAKIGELELRDMRIDYLTLGGSRGDDILIADCAIHALDMPQAQLKRVGFERSRADEVDPRGMRVTDVDLRGLEVVSYLDTASLRGTTMTVRQTELLAPAFAAAAGIQVTD